MALRVLLPIMRLRCALGGHDWAAHRYETPDPNDLQICTRCDATKRGLPAE